MASKSAEFRRLAGQKGMRRRWHPDQPTDDLDAAIEAARAQSRVEGFIDRLIKEAPPLTPEQRDRIIGVLHARTVTGGEVRD